MTSTAQAKAPDPRGSGAAAPALVVTGLGKRYGGVQAVDGISLELAAGERMGVIGPNGAGKTTLFKMIAGDVAPTTGTIELFGRDVTHMSTAPRARLGVGRTFQVSNLFRDMSVLDNVRVAARGGSSKARAFWRTQGMTDDVTRESILMLDSLGLTGRRDDTVADLSHGEKRQLEIAMALVSHPSILLLDEPAAGLSAAERATLRQLIEELPRTLPILLIEHDMTLALGLTDRVMCMENGRHVVTGTPDEVREHPTVKEIYLGRRDKK
ncbi:ABC transporter ATP-binding protein [Microbacterium ulmi]|uniref:ABC transporter ATP-binding protein n=1 Tax=Microbacterium ulmi TaxID=179095 RepID=A0A7Y2LY62_9MICO|nr:ABC transporter ATP-binding protein [Microbacterium ulmi]NII68494.1 branched-chain amino acid transport system ATP-binding protein [Microbacterium ulmi]NNH02984.1 ABC transporter ATP-binding protein [Microbacterium ulmi]